MLAKALEEERSMLKENTKFLNEFLSGDECQSLVRDVAQSMLERGQNQVYVRIAQQKMYLIVMRGLYIAPCPHKQIKYDFKKNIFYYHLRNDDKISLREADFKEAFDVAINFVKYFCIDIQIQTAPYEIFYYK